MSRPSLNTTTRQVLGLLLLPFRAPLLFLLFGIAVYLGMHWRLTDGHATLAEGPCWSCSGRSIVCMRCW